MRSPRTRWWEPSSWLEDCYLLAESLNGGGRERTLSGSSSYNNTNPIMEAQMLVTSSKPYHLPKTLPPNIIKLGIRASNMTWGMGGRHKCSVLNTRWITWASFQQISGTISSIIATTMLISSGSFTHQSPTHHYLYLYIFNGFFSNDLFFASGCYCVDCFIIFHKMYSFLTAV